MPERIGLLKDGVCHTAYAKWGSQRTPRSAVVDGLAAGPPCGAGGDACERGRAGKASLSTPPLIAVLKPGLHPSMKTSCPWGSVDTADVMRYFLSHRSSCGLCRRARPPAREHQQCAGAGAIPGDRSTAALLLVAVRLEVSCERKPLMSIATRLTYRPCPRGSPVRRMSWSAVSGTRRCYLGGCGWTIAFL
jgi:hypothetical protein